MVVEGRQLQRVDLGMVDEWADSAVAGVAFEGCDQAECSTDIPAVR